MSNSQEVVIECELVEKEIISTEFIEKEVFTADIIGVDLLNYPTPVAGKVINDSFVLGDTVKDALETLKNTVVNGIISIASGQEKQIVSMTYNPITGKITLNYND